MTDRKFHPLKLSLGQIALRDIAVQQIGELLATLERLDAISVAQADREVIMDIRTSPIEE